MGAPRLNNERSLAVNNEFIFIPTLTNIHLIQGLHAMQRSVQARRSTRISRLYYDSELFSVGVGLCIPLASTCCG